MKYKIFLTLALSVLVFTSCTKEPKPKHKKEVVREKGEVVNNIEVKSVEINATDYHKWVYFSFKQGKVVDVTDPKNDLSWDIAFKRSYVKTNGGTSGKGQARGMETPFKSFKEMDVTFMIQNDKYFKADTIEQIPTDPNQDGRIVFVDQSLNPELNKAVKVIPRQTTAPEIRLSKVVYFFRDAEGKYGAIKFINYFKAIDKLSDLKGGYVSIEYQYPIDPTKK